MKKSKNTMLALCMTSALAYSQYKSITPVYASSFIPNVNSTAYNNDNIFTQCGYKGECTWFTYGRTIEKLGIHLPKTFYGNALNWWYDNIKDNVYSYGQEPRANSIVVWSGGSKGYGHVGFVEKVEGNTVYFNEGNVEKRGFYDGRLKALSKENIKYRGNLYLKGYIYLDNNTSRPSRGESISNNTIIKTGYVTLKNKNSSLNVRNQASLSSSIIDSLSYGEKVNVLAEQNGWYKIQFRNKTGYVKNNYISNSSNSNNSVSFNTGVVTLSSNSSILNVRISPRVGNVIYTLKNGANVKIIETSNGWHKIKAGSIEGYVCGNYIKPCYNNSNTSATSNNNIISQNKNLGTVALNDKSSVLNMRNNPNGRIINTLPHGTKVEIIQKNNSWYKVKYGSLYGYVSSYYIK